MPNETADWRRLKSSWHELPVADLPEPGDLRARLTRRIWLSRAWLASEIVSFVILGLYIVMNAAAGNSGIAIGIAVVTLLCFVLTLWARRGRDVGNLDSLPGMVDFTLSRTRKGLRLVYGSYLVLGILFIATFAERLGAFELPGGTEEHFFVRVVWLSMSAGAALAYHLVLKARLVRFESIRRAFG